MGINTNFDVGPGVLSKMEQLGDVPARDSAFFHSKDGKSLSEWGYGLKYDYRAVKDADRDWQVIAYALPLIK